MTKFVCAIIAILVAVNHTVSGEEFNCEKWRNQLNRPVQQKIKCGKGGMAIRCAISMRE